MVLDAHASPASTNSFVTVLMLTPVARLTARVDKFSAEGWLASWPRAPVPEMAAFMDVLGTEYHKVVTGEVSVEDAAKAAQRGMNRVMRKAGYF